MEQKIRGVIRIAINAEEQAYRIYRLGLSKAGLSGSKALFRRLMREELRHKMGLTRLLNGRIAASIAPKAPNLMVAERISTTPLSELDELLQIISFAIRKEQAAQRRYKRMARLFKGRARTMIKGFERQEKSHEEMLRREMMKIS